MPDRHDYNEAETRDRFIDLLLREAGWALDQPRGTRVRSRRACRTTRASASSTTCCGARTASRSGSSRQSAPARTPAKGQQQAKLYADCLEARYGQRPVIFYSNGYEHWIWDDTRYPPRQIGGFYKRDELELLIQRRTSRKPLAAERDQPHDRRAALSAPGDPRHRQELRGAISERKALLVMATGSGKTRTVIALVDLLMRAGWVKRVLFLADRVALVNQATGAFKAHLPDAAPVNLVTERTAEGRVFLSTYPTMMNLIDGKTGGQAAVRPRPFRPGRHRRGAPLGLPALPRDLRVFRLLPGRADRHAEGRGRPQHLFAVRPRGRRADRRLFARRGGGRRATWCRRRRSRCRSRSCARACATTSCPRRRRTSGTCWNGARTEIPDSVEAAEVNKRLFNADTVDQVIAHLMQNGRQGRGRRPARQDHHLRQEPGACEFIEQRFNADYPELAGHFARVITHKTGPTPRR